MPPTSSTDIVFTILLATITSTQPYTPSNVFIGGLGYVGSRLGSAIHNAFPQAKISGTVRSLDRQELYSSSRPTWLTGNVHVLDIDDRYFGLDSVGLYDLIEADTIIQTVAPIADFDTDPILAFHKDQLMKSPSGALKYVVYISSTGVYGNHDGKWVSEEDELLCTDAKSLARIKAEREWGVLEQAPDDSDGSTGIVAPRVDYFRCGGIYGLGRGPLFSSLESLTEAIMSQDEDREDINKPIKYVNRILAEDICSAIISGIRGKRPFYSGGRAYNLVDDDPAQRMDVVAEARRLLLAKENGASEVNNISPSSDTSIASINTRRRVSRGTGNKRCSNIRLKTEYGWKPTAPTFREGLASLVSEMDELI